jgi:hypothetical protein
MGLSSHSRLGYASNIASKFAHKTALSTHDLRDFAHTLSYRLSFLAGAKVLSHLWKDTKKAKFSGDISRFEE